jgi:hypothetical protein
LITYVSSKIKSLALFIIMFKITITIKEYRINVIDDSLAFYANVLYEDIVINFE